ncbi:unnamed protein product [Chironomus riparius]|uniref:Cytochrome P450 n=1 Tax=Chironomus riparius TaxID=315576 RepID=A0A9P0J8N8_9DIPT|nr:unnamed protein product [Chironomus riparius]
MTLAVVFALSIVVFGLIYFYIHKRYSFLEEHGFLHEKPRFPFGNMHGAGKKFHPIQIFQRGYKKFKNQAPAFGQYFFLAHNIVLTDLDVIKDVMIKSFDVFHNRGLFHSKEHDPLTAHLLTLEDQDWRNMRMKLSPTFTSGKMKVMFHTVLDVSKYMIKTLEAKSNLDTVEIKEVLAQFTTDVIGNIAFGLEMKAIDNPDSNFRLMGRKIFGRNSNFLIRLFFLTSFRDLAKNLRLKLLPNEVSEFFRGIVRETVEYRTQNKIERNDFLDLLLKVKEGQSDEDILTIDQIAAQCFLFFIAGFETSSSTATFVLYNLVQHPEIQEKVKNEIETIVAKYDNKVTYDGIVEMKYLQMVIDESLRMFPPVPQIIRKPSRDYKIPGSDLVIPKGSLVIIPNYSIHNDPENYPEPDKFDPERFSEENKLKRHPMTFLPFGDGPRNCIGFRFGLMQTKIALVQLLLNFKFSTTPQTPTHLEIDPSIATLSSLNDIVLKVEKI